MRIGSAPDLPEQAKSSPSPSVSRVTLCMRVYTAGRRGHCAASSGAMTDGAFSRPNCVLLADACGRLARSHAYCVLVWLQGRMAER